MNCKEGERAIIINAVAHKHAIGCIVTCVKFMPSRLGEPAWIVDREFGPPILAEGTWRRGNWFFDKNLRPIRDQPGEDEMLRIAGKPQPVSA